MLASAWSPALALAMTLAMARICASTSGDLSIWVVADGGGVKRMFRFAGDHPLLTRSGGQGFGRAKPHGDDSPAPPQRPP